MDSKKKRLPVFWRNLGGFVLAAVIAGAISPILFDHPHKTNREYLREIIEHHVMEETASKLVTQWKTAPDAGNYTAQDWEKVQEGLSQCLVAQAKAYEASDDPYLDQQANTDSPKVLATRLLTICGAAP